MPAYPKIVFLDQNKWIDLTHAFVNRDKGASLFQMGERLIEAVITGRMLFPLTANLIIETYKMSDDVNRGKLAEVQAKFSQGYVYCARDFRIRHELSKFIRASEGMPDLATPRFWWLAKNFVEAFASWRQLAAESLIEPDQLQGIMADPKFSLYHWLTTAPKEERGQAMKLYESGSSDLIKEIMARVNRLKNESFSTRQKVYSASLALDEGTRILDTANANGVPWNGVSDIGGARLRRLMREVPSYNAEIELASRIESMNRHITSNDLRDMQGYVSALPYANLIIGENMFVNVAKQAGLDKRYGCQIATDIHVLDQHV